MRHLVIQYKVVGKDDTFTRYIKEAEENLAWIQELETKNAHTMDRLLYVFGKSGVHLRQYAVFKGLETHGGVMANATGWVKFQEHGEGSRAVFAEVYLKNKARQKRNPFDTFWTHTDQGPNLNSDIFDNIVRDMFRNVRW